MKNLKLKKMVMKKITKKTDEKSGNKRDSFVFYRSCFEAIETLSKKNKLIAFETIVRYALDQEMPESLPSNVLGIFKMAQPNIDSANKKYFNRLKGKAQKKKDCDEQEFGECIRLPEKKHNVKDDEFLGGENDDCFDDGEPDEFE